MKNENGGKERIRQIAMECISLAEENKGELEFLGKYSGMIKNTVDSLINTAKPKLMVCGVYNAGKSTLVNVICREKVAEVGDNPLTWKIDEYDLPTKDYVLVDSPGVNAPQEHEAVTDEYIKNCHALMFVVSTKNLEDKVVYEKIIEWMGYEKPLIIVMNDRSTSKELESVEIVKLREKIVSNLKTAGYDTSKKYSIMAVNAKRAEQTVFEGKSEKLFEMSNVGQLESVVDGIMKSGYAILMAPIGNLQNILDRMESELSSNVFGNNDKNIAAALERVKSDQRYIAENLAAKIKDLYDSRRNDILNIFLSADSQEAFDKNLAEILESTGKQVERIYENRLAGLADAVNLNLKQYGINMNTDGTIKIGSLTTSFDELLKNAYDGFDDSTDFGAIAKSTISGAMGGAAIGSAITGLSGTAAASSIAAFTSTLIPASVGGAGGAALAGIPFGPIGIIAGAALGLFVGLSSARKKREAQEQAIAAQLAEENRRRQEAMDAYYKKAQTEVSVIINKVSDKAVSEVSAMFSAAVSGIENTLNASMAASEKKNEHIDALRKKITTLKTELNAIKGSLQ